VRATCSGGSSSSGGGGGGGRSGSSSRGGACGGGGSISSRAKDSRGDGTATALAGADRKRPRGGSACVAVALGDCKFRRRRRRAVCLSVSQPRRITLFVRRYTQYLFVHLQPHLPRNLTAHQPCSAEQVAGTFRQTFVCCVCVRVCACVCVCLLGHERTPYSCADEVHVLKERQGAIERFERIVYATAQSRGLNGGTCPVQQELQQKHHSQPVFPKPSSTAQG
jgi:hypothetical protein